MLMISSIKERKRHVLFLKMLHAKKAVMDQVHEFETSRDYTKVEQNKKWKILKLFVIPEIDKKITSLSVALFSRPDYLDKGLIDKVITDYLPDEET